MSSCNSYDFTLTNDTMSYIPLTYSHASLIFSVIKTNQMLSTHEQSVFLPKSHDILFMSFHVGVYEGY